MYDSCVDQRKKHMYFTQLCHLLQQMKETEALVLGGSRACNSYDENSDYDLYVY